MAPLAVAAVELGAGVQGLEGEAMTKSLTPTCCGECPFQYDFIECQHPDGPGVVDDIEELFEKTAPVWCPLRKGSAVIALKPSSELVQALAEFRASRLASSDKPVLPSYEEFSEPIPFRKGKR